MTDIRHPHIDRALAAVRAERDILEAERDAFETLLRRVSAIQVDARASTAVQSGAVTAASIARPTEVARGLGEVRDAYRETVMEVPHYEIEYDESLRANLAAEFGEPLASRIVDGTVLTRQVYDAVTDACRQARDERKRALQYVERERDRLVAFEADLTAIERDVVEAGAAIESASGTRQLSRIDDTLATLQSRCLGLANERQTQLRESDQIHVLGSDGFGFYEYLYADLETPAPVLSDAGACLKTIQGHRMRGLRAE
ncbi:DUF7260 family protein [Halapricum hydrolyticum]|uniref:DUF7260 domain-containing protein n=1 Tax=Halapricum hydrolyticum TaxID=2979991 RepID=A0AAE3I8U5_9EURY|nr:hypothetical protein [Halapricum hydrolyticum]MCU4716490.1 hypothetical protein [Halapricum hydrolyticum]MCU4725905.1 hypothetical protein [Halapricum hydrolyticum]